MWADMPSLKPRAAKERKAAHMCDFMWARWTSIVGKSFARGGGGSGVPEVIFWRGLEPRLPALAEGGDMVWSEWEIRGWVRNVRSAVWS